MTRDDLLKWVLRFIGGVELLAIPFILLPFAWMKDIHAALPGLGSLPDGAVVEYMARSLSAIYALHGAVVFFVSFDVNRYRPLIRMLGTLHIAIGLTVFCIDLVAGLPPWWVFGEGPGIVAGGILMLIFSREQPVT